MCIIIYFVDKEIAQHCKVSVKCGMWLKEQKPDCGLWSKSLLGDRPSRYDAGSHRPSHILPFWRQNNLLTTSRFTLTQRHAAHGLLTNGQTARRRQHWSKRARTGYDESGWRVGHPGTFQMWRHFVEAHLKYLWFHLHCVPDMALSRSNNPQRLSRKWSDNNTRYLCDYYFFFFF